MNEILSRWDLASLEAAAAQILPCCGSTAWSLEMARRRPFSDEVALMSASDAIWRSLDRSDWIEAFRSHPRIGDPSSHAHPSERSSTWAAQEQEKVGDAGEAIKIALAEGNREYERKFGRIFLICATGKSADEILETLNRRLHSDPETELQEAAEQQRQITQIRLRKWLST